MIARIESFDPVQIRGAYIEQDEIQNVVSYIAKQKECDFELPAVEEIM